MFQQTVLFFFFSEIFSLINSNLICSDPNEVIGTLVTIEPSCRFPYGFDVASEISLYKMCRCKQGYLRHLGKCIIKESCPVVCGPNEEIPRACMSSTQRTCKIPHPSEFKHDCVFNECRCMKGFLRRKDKRCVKPDDCSI